jgi:two-component system sensor histidine kinase HydH
MKKIITPLQSSATIAAGYIIICGVYIWFSGAIAARLSSSIPALQNIELYKGLAYVIITGLILFFILYNLLARIVTQNRELELQKKALIAVQSRALTGSFAAGIAHDINNVLGVVDFGIDELRDIVPEEKMKFIDRLDKAFTMIGDLSRRLQKIGKVNTTIDMTDVKVSEFVHQIVDFASRHRKLKSCKVTLVDQGSSGTFCVNPYLIEQMLINMMINAADATECKGTIRIVVTTDIKSVQIEIHDNGPGIAPNLRETIFEAYYTTKPDGSGLGLATVKICAELHGGTVQIDSSSLGGALFRVMIPRKIIKQQE